jgi:hypothetical protein
MKPDKIWADKKVAEAFKRACSASGVSMTSEVSQFMKGRINCNIFYPLLASFEFLSVRRQ